jgi:hypothetical protein
MRTRPEPGRVRREVRARPGAARCSPTCPGSGCTGSGCNSTRQSWQERRRHEVEVSHYKPEADNPLDEPPQRILIW